MRPCSRRTVPKGRKKDEVGAVGMEEAGAALAEHQDALGRNGFADMKFGCRVGPMTSAATQPTVKRDNHRDRALHIARVREILATVKPLAAEYYRLTGKPLGVTGEVAEFIAAEHLGLELADARTAGYDAVRRGPNGPVYIQIKRRAYGDSAKPGQRLGRIKTEAYCDIVLLVLLDSATLEPREMWEAPFSEVLARLAEPGSKARNERGALSVRDFKRLSSARLVWPSSNANSR